MTRRVGKKTDGSLSAWSIGPDENGRLHVGFCVLLRHAMLVDERAEQP